MFERTEDDVAGNAYQLGGLALMIALVVILMALGFEYLGGYLPCPLCLQQRYAYYAGVVLIFIAMALVAEHPRVAALLFFIVSLAFFANTGLGVYHAGVEWKFWPGPDTCAVQQALPTTAEDLLKGLETTRAIRCDEAAWRLFGLSFAGWNAVVSLVLTIMTLQAAFAVPQKS